MLLTILGEMLSSPSLSAFALLGLGLVFGLKHATEVDHVVAVSAIVSEHRNIFRSILVGGLWGLGHTASLIVVGVFVLALRVAIPERVSNWLEFGVALMIIVLGAIALTRALQRRKQIHIHKHKHDSLTHVHIHFHEKETDHKGQTESRSDADSQTQAELHSHAESHSHAVSRVGIKPFLVGAMHGLAGSAALTLLVLTQVQSAALGLVYLAVFGIGSVIGMLLMSGLIGLPFAISARRLSGAGFSLQIIAGGLSIAFGFWYAYEIAIGGG
jgi:ABC-type nickel/cobalt efflux system permease component RcnA